MSILNTFWILFKSNADDVIKGNKAIEKSTKETEKALKNTTDSTQDLGRSFVKMVEGAASAAGALAGFELLKNGINNANTYNASLKVLADQIGTTAQTLKTMGQAATEAGGSVAGALADIKSLSDQANAAGLPLGSPEAAFGAIRGRLKGKSLNEKNRLLSNYGINDPGDRRRLAVLSDSEYAASISSAASVTPLSQENANKALDAISAQAHAKAAASNVATTQASTISPIVNKLLDKFSSIAGWVAGNPSASVGVGIGGIAAGGIGAGWLGKIFGNGVTSLFSKSATPAFVDSFAPSAAGGAGLLPSLGVAGAGLLGGGAAGYGIVSLFSKSIEAAMVKYLTSDIKTSSPVTKAFKTGSTDMDFWMSKGYSREQALGIMANMKQESGGDPTARGDGGHAHGLFQWHADRRAAIFKATGIDVSKAGYKDQLEAAAWEMKNGRRQFDDSHFRTLNSPDAAAAYFSQKFEAPANGAMQAIIRGKSALNLASQFPAIGSGGGTASVKIDKIIINTQATDAAGIADHLKDEIYSQLSILAANHDDGVQS